jgi:hypothetical protein
LGTLHYGGSRASIRMDDRALAHLQVVITTKLRRNEGFLVQWERPRKGGSSRGGFWVHPSCDLAYEYDGEQNPGLDPEELDRMMLAASGTHGVRVDAEAHDRDYDELEMGRRGGGERVA